MAALVVASQRENDFDITYRWLQDQHHRPAQSLGLEQGELDEAEAYKVDTLDLRIYLRGTSESQMYEIEKKILDRREQRMAMLNTASNGRATP